MIAAFTATEVMLLHSVAILKADYGSASNTFTYFVRGATDDTVHCVLVNVIRTVATRSINHCLSLSSSPSRVLMKASTYHEQILCHVLEGFIARLKSAKISVGRSSGNRDTLVDIPAQTRETLHGSCLCRPLYISDQMLLIR